MQDKSLVFWAVLTLGVSLGCGGITQPLGEVEQGGGGAGGSGGLTGGATSNPGGASPAHGCETECVQRILTAITSCALCHGSQPAPAGLQSSGLDLASPNVTTRLKDVPARHLDLPVAAQAGCPVGDKLIDTATPEDSWLLKKITGQQGNCGDPMPQTSAIGGEDLECLQTYVHCVAGK